LFPPSAVYATRNPLRTALSDNCCTHLTACFILSVCVLLISSTTSWAAEIKVFEGGMGLRVISVEGIIERRDTKRLITAAETLGSHPTPSKFGSTAAAAKQVRWISANTFTSTVFRPSSLQTPNATACAHSFG
jgi:hypothetical protein